MNRWYVIWIVVFCLGLSVPFFFGNYLTNLFALVFITAISVLGLNYIVRNTGQVSLGHASIQAIGAYAAAIFVSMLHVPIWVAFLIAPICSGIFGMILAVSSIRLNGPYFSVITLALSWAVSEALLLFSGVTGGYQGLFVSQFTWISSPVVTMYFLALILFMLSALIVRNIQISKFGTVLLLMKRSPQAAASLGVNVVRYKIVSITIGNMFAGLSGVLYLYLVSSITPQAFSFSQSAYFLVASVVGGTSSPFGALLGSLVTVCLPSFLSDFQYYASVILGLILIVMLAFFPGGLTGIKMRLTKRSDEPEKPRGMAYIAKN